MEWLWFLKLLVSRSYCQTGILKNRMPGSIPEPGMLLVRQPGNDKRVGDHTTPWASIASATFTNPAMLAPST